MAWWKSILNIVDFSLEVGVRCAGHFGNWYNMRINMSGKMPMRCAAKVPRVRYSAAYPTGAERIVKVTPLPCGLSTMVLLYQ